MSTKSHPDFSCELCLDRVLSRCVLLSTDSSVFKKCIQLRKQLYGRWSRNNTLIKNRWTGQIFFTLKLCLWKLTKTKVYYIPSKIVRKCNNYWYYWKCRSSPSGFRHECAGALVIIEATYFPPEKRLSKQPKKGCKLSNNIHIKR